MDAIWARYAIALFGGFAGVAMSEVLSVNGKDALARLSEENETLRIELEALHARLAELERLADTDTLVPLPNRRAFLRELERVIHHAVRYGTPSAVLFIDLNGLKGVNDRHGHQAGDAVLLHVSRMLKLNLRAADTVARIGGDEFGLILDHLDEASATAKARSLVDEVANSPIEIGKELVRANVTVGLAMVRDTDDVDSVLARADAAMYAQRSDR
jgi:diguanylate cyclase (GGDEF)-like protein